MGYRNRTASFEHDAATLFDIVYQLAGTVAAADYTRQQSVPTHVLSAICGFNDAG